MRDWASASISSRSRFSAKVTDTIGGIPFLQAVANGILDGAEIQRETRAFPPVMGGDAAWKRNLKGRVGTVDNVGCTTAQITVNSDLVLLDINMPRNLYSPNCQHVLYDSGCALVKGAHGASGTVGGRINERHH